LSIKDHQKRLKMLIEYKKFAENQDYEDFVVEINQLE